MQHFNHNVHQPYTLKMRKVFSHSDFPGHRFTAYDGPFKNGHLFGLNHNTPTGQPLEIVAEQEDEFGEVLGDVHIVFDEKLTLIPG